MNETPNYKEYNDWNKKDAHVVVPEGYTSIAEGAFEDARDYEKKVLESVSLPDGLLRLNYNSFDYVEKIRELSLPDTIEIIHSYAIFVPGHNALYELPNLSDDQQKNTKLIIDRIPRNLKKIGDSALCGTTLKGKLYIGKDLQMIGDNSLPFRYLFDQSLGASELLVVDPKNLFFTAENGALYSKDKTILYKVFPYYQEKEFHIPSTVKEIKATCFTFIDTLETVIADGVIDNLGEDIIHGCRNFKTFKFHDDQRRFNFTYRFPNYPSYVFIERSQEKCIQLPDEIEEIPKWIVRNRKYLKLPTQLRTISEEFYCNQSLRSYTIPKGIKVIGKKAFYGNSLESIDIPEGVEQIGIEAFANNLIENIRLPKSAKIVSKDIVGKNIRTFTMYDSTKCNISEQGGRNFLGKKKYSGYTVIILSSVNDEEKFRVFIPLTNEGNEIIRKLAELYVPGKDYDFEKADALFNEMKYSKIPYAYTRLYDDDIEKREFFAAYLARHYDEFVKYVVDEGTVEDLITAKKYGVTKEKVLAESIAYAKYKKRTDIVDYLKKELSISEENSELVGFVKIDKQDFLISDEPIEQDTFSYGWPRFRGPQREAIKLVNYLKDKQIRYQLNKGDNQDLIDVLIKGRYFSLYKMFPTLKAICLEETRHSWILRYSESGYNTITGVKSGHGDAFDPCDYTDILGDFVRFDDYWNEDRCTYKFPKAFKELWLNHDYVYEINGEYYKKADAFDNRNDSFDEFNHMEETVMTIDDTQESIPKDYVKLDIYNMPEYTRYVISKNVTNIERQPWVGYLFEMPDGFLQTRKQLSGEGLFDHVNYYWNPTLKDFAYLYLFQKSKSLLKVVEKHIPYPCEPFAKALIEVAKQENDPKINAKVKLFVKQNRDEISDETYRSLSSYPY